MKYLSRDWNEVLLREHRAIGIIYLATKADGSVRRMLSAAVQTSSIRMSL